MSALRIRALCRSWARLACLCLLAFLAAGAHAAPANPSPPILERIDALIASEAWQLARRLIDSLPEANETDAEDLERRRLTVYRHVPDPAALAARIERLPVDASSDFRRWALEQLVEAALAARDFERARSALQQLLATPEGKDDRKWRERLVRSYLEEGRAADALAAFAPLSEQEDARTLHAEILLHAGQDREAFERVAGLASPEARLWRLLAASRLELYAPADLLQELSLLVRDLRERPELQRVAWLMRADAAKQTGQLVRRVNSLEQAFRFDDAPASRLATATPDDLWSAYLALGRHIALTENLSLGTAALARADAYGKQDTYSARALYAWHAIEARDSAVRADGHERLADSLTRRKLVAVMRALYTGSKRFVAGEIPGKVRHALMRDALNRRDFRAAAQHARELPPPPEESAANWDLQRARVMLYGGEPDAAVELLQRLLARDDFDEAFARRFLQVVFDLQALDRHADALELLEAVHARVDNPRMHRELLYWEAESAAALKRFADAAELYLRSARHGDEDGTDPWGHSARFRAAEALAKAGLKRDAEGMYLGLLKETTDPDRRLLIEQNIERLWLAAPTATTP